MAGRVHQPVAVGDHADAALGERIHDADDVVLVAGDGARREDDDIALGHLDARMVVEGDAGERGARLALAAGEQHDDLVARQIGVGVLGEERRHVVEHAEFAGDIDDPAHGAADDDDVAAGRAGGKGDRAQTPDVGGKRGEGDAPAAGRADDLGELARDFGLARAAAFAHGIGRVRHQRQNAFLADRLEPRHVGRQADGRLIVELPVATVQDEAERRADGERMGFGDRMGDVDVFDLERPERDAVAGLDDVDRHRLGVGLAGDLGRKQVGGEGRRVDRHLEPRPQIDQRAEVILVGVGDDDAEEVDAFLLEVADIGEDQIDAGQIGMGEGDAEIDRQPDAVMAGAEAVEAEVHADLADPAERQEDQFVLGGARHAGLPAARKEHVAGADRLTRAVLADKDQPPAVIERLEAPDHGALGKIGADRAADADGASKPGRADGGKAAAVIPQWSSSFMRTASGRTGSRHRPAGHGRRSRRPPGLRRSQDGTRN